MDDLLIEDIIIEPRPTQSIFRSKSFPAIPKVASLASDADDEVVELLSSDDEEERPKVTQKSASHDDSIVEVPLSDDESNPPPPPPRLTKTVTAKVAYPQRPVTATAFISSANRPISLFPKISVSTTSSKKPGRPASLFPKFTVASTARRPISRGPRSSTPFSDRPIIQPTRSSTPVLDQPFIQPTRNISPSANRPITLLPMSNSSSANRASSGLANSRISPPILSDSSISPPSRPARSISQSGSGSSARAVVTRRSSVEVADGNSQREEWSWSQGSHLNSLDKERRKRLFDKLENNEDPTYVNMIMTEPTELDNQRAWQLYVDTTEGREKKPYKTVTNFGSAEQMGPNDVDEADVFSIDECITLTDYSCINMESNPMGFSFLYSQGCLDATVIGKVRDTSKCKGALKNAKDLHVMLRFSDVFIEWESDDFEPKSFGVTTYTVNGKETQMRYYYLKGIAHEHYQRVGDRFNACLRLAGEMFSEARKQKYPQNFLPDKSEDDAEEDEDLPEDVLKDSIRESAIERLKVIRARFDELCPKQEVDVGTVVLSRFVCDQALDLDRKCDDGMFLTTTSTLVDLINDADYELRQIYEDIDSYDHPDIWTNSGLEPQRKRNRRTPSSGGASSHFGGGGHFSSAMRRQREIVCTPIIERIIGAKAQGFVGRAAVPGGGTDDAVKEYMIKPFVRPSEFELLEQMSFGEGKGHSRRTYYSKVLLHPQSSRGSSLPSFVVKPGDAVAVRDGKVYLIVSLWAEFKDNALLSSTVKRKMTKHGFHAVEFLPAKDTIVENAAPPNELFFAGECFDRANLTEIHQKVKLHIRKPLTQAQFRVRSAQEVADYYQRNADLVAAGEYFTIFCYDRKTPSFYYDARQLNDVVTARPLHCAVCKQKAKREYEQGPRLEGGGDVGLSSGGRALVLRGERYRVGHTVLVDPSRIVYSDGAFRRRFTIKHRAPGLEKLLQEYQSDPEMYPEFDRFSLTQEDRFRLKEMATCLAVGVIERIYRQNNEPAVQLRMLMRCGDTAMSNSAYLNRGHPAELLWSDLVRDLGGKDDVLCIVGRCYLKTNLKTEDTQNDWLNGGPLRFFMNERIDEDTRLPSASPPLADVDLASVALASVDAPLHPAIPAERRLRSVDAFSGAGGLSLGLHQAGITDTKFAIEWNKNHAAVFKENFPGATVHTKGINLILDDMIKEGLEADFLTRLPYPKRGEIDLVVGGPPCQGFSGMNSNKGGSDAHGKRSLISAFMTLVSYLRPRFVLMENVNGMSQHRVGSYTNGVKSQGNEDKRQSLYLVPLLVEQLKAMGYQVSFRKLQAAQYGVPQDRRRVFLVGAAPEERIPSWPLPLTACGMDYMAPTHNLKSAVFSCFNERMYKSPCWIDDGDSLVEGKEQLAELRFDNENDRRAEALRISAAPYPPVTIGDCLQGLPHRARMDRSEQTDAYRPTDNYFAKKMRGTAKAVEDHVAFPLSPTKMKRLHQIPYPEEFPFADWSSLPNVEDESVNGRIRKIEYKYGSCVIGAGVTKSHRALCPCMRTREKDDCDFRGIFPSFFKSFIPAFLPHTAIRNKQWEGAYGRLVPWYHFPTIVTKPDVTGKQGRVTHPTEDRYMTVREFARGQGFPDTFRFSALDPDKRNERIPIASRYEQIGNAVPPPVSLAIGREMARVLMPRGASSPPPPEGASIADISLVSSTDHLATVIDDDEGEQDKLSTRPRLPDELNQDASDEGNDSALLPSMEKDEEQQSPVFTLKPDRRSTSVDDAILIE